MPYAMARLNTDPLHMYYKSILIDNIVAIIILSLVLYVHFFSYQYLDIICVNINFQLVSS